MLARVQSFVLHGVDALPCEVEVDLSDSGWPKEAIVGLPDAAVKESLDRVRSAVTNAGYTFPTGRLVINLAPAHVRKEGSVYDLPIAVGALAATGAINPYAPAEIHTRSSCAQTTAQLVAGDSDDSLREQDELLAPDEPPVEQAPALDLKRYLFAGELALDGRLRPIRGVIAMATMALERGFTGVVVPAGNAAEAAVVEGLEAIGVRTIQEVVGLINGAIEPTPHPPVRLDDLIAQTAPSVDFADVRGQESVKRAITIAAAGMHNILMLGPAGSGKTMMARALPGILPPLTPTEALETTRVYSAAGQLPVTEDGELGLITVRPVRAPHHSASAPALIGGGATPKPGEISLAHHGVLFLDELPEFPRQVLETLRQPLEDRSVTIARAHSSVRFPASFMLVAAMNPTPKGHMPTDQASQREMDRYLSRISGPLLDRIDIHVEAPAVPWKKLASSRASGTSSAQMREQVLAARRRQRARQGETLNAHLRGRDLDKLAPLDDDAKSLLGQALTELGLSARAYDKIRRVARTIADIEGAGSIAQAHVAEAVQYRLLDRRV